jgi:quinol monooxygenase YgiN
MGREYVREGKPVHVYAASSEIKAQAMTDQRRQTVSKITIVAKIVAKKVEIEAVKTELLKLVLPTKKESGCIEYRLHQDSQDPAVFLFYETWESDVSLEKHKNTDHYKAYVKALEGKIADKVVNKMTRVE